MTKFAPFALAPLLLRGTEERLRRRQSSASGRLRGSRACSRCCRCCSRRPLGLLARLDPLPVRSHHPFSIWGLWGGLGWLQSLLQGAVIALALGVAFLPRAARCGRGRPGRRGAHRAPAHPQLLALSLHRLVLPARGVIAPACGSPDAAARRPSRRSAGTARPRGRADSQPAARRLAPAGCEQPGTTRAAGASTPARSLAAALISVVISTALSHGSSVRSRSARASWWPSPRSPARA